MLPDPTSFESLGRPLHGAYTFKISRYAPVILLSEYLLFLSGKGCKNSKCLPKVRKPRKHLKQWKHARITITIIVKFINMIHKSYDQSMGSI